LAAVVTMQAISWHTHFSDKLTGKT